MRDENNLKKSVIEKIKRYENDINQYNLNDLDLQLLKLKEDIDELDSPELLFQYYNLEGFFYFQIGSFEKAMNSLDQALLIFRKNKKLITGAYKTYSRIGTLYAYIEFFDKAEEYFNKALTLVESKQGEISCLTNIGNIFSIKGDFDSALQYQKRALDLVSETNDYIYMKKAILNNIGKTYHSMKEHEQAMNYYLKSLSIKKTTPQHDYNTFYNIASLYMEKLEYHNSIEYGETALKHAHENGHQNDIFSACSLLSHCYEEIGDFYNGIKYLKLAMEAKGKLYNDNLALMITKEQIKNQIAKKEQDNVIYKLKNKVLTDLNSQLEKKNKYLEEAYKKINMQQAALKSKNQALEKLIDDKNSILHFVAHDLRNPLGVIKASTELLEYDSRFQEDLSVYEKIKMIRTSTLNMNSLIDELLYHAESEEIKKYQFHHENISLIIQEAVNDVENKIIKKKQELIFNANEFFFADVDRFKLKRAFINLLSNANKFTMPKGKITIELNDYEDKISISISDNGIGIPEKAQKHIFDKFTKSGRLGTNGEPSTGLGMSIIKNIVEAHNGKIILNSQENIGTTFTVTLPKKHELIN